MSTNVATPIATKTLVRRPPFADIDVPLCVPRTNAAKRPIRESIKSLTTNECKIAIAGCPPKQKRSSFWLLRFCYMKDAIVLVTTGRMASAAAPYVDADEQEQPHHVDEVPIPGREFEAEMLLRRELTSHRAQQADD